MSQVLFIDNTVFMQNITLNLEISSFIQIYFRF